MKELSYENGTISIIECKGKRSASHDDMTQRVITNSETGACPRVPLEMMLVTDMQCHPQSFYDLVNIMREHEEIFPEWHASETAKLYSPKIFENKKKAGGYWF